ncbi:hypothetical protein COCCU_01800 [Corynebacterium occultum]|uniref:Uncharacterized protein n=1 Tax=Corynebacterium occultum TaxID=2675219 RepID=A0A6B8VTD8_9CORY|nr:hypothetical protein COCCU_01800 [Corynebacterium occultum]
MPHCRRNVQLMAPQVLHFRDPRAHNEGKVDTPGKQRTPFRVWYAERGSGNDRSYQNIPRV